MSRNTIDGLSSITYTLGDFIGLTATIANFDTLTATNLNTNAVNISGVTVSNDAYVGNVLYTDTIETRTNLMNIASSANITSLNIGCGQTATNIKIGVHSGVVQNPSTIQIGNEGDTVLLGGTASYVNVDNLSVTNKQMFLNSGQSGLNTSTGSGLFINDNGVTGSGYLKVKDLFCQQFELKAPSNSYKLSTPTLSQDSDFIISSGDQGITGVKTFSDVVTTGFTATTANIYEVTFNASNPNIQASKILLTDVNKTVVSSTLAENQIATVNTTQTISGAKTFSGGITMSNNIICSLGSTLQIGNNSTIAPSPFSAVAMTVGQNYNIEFGRGKTKSNDAGKIGYQTFSNDLDIVGAGVTGNRTVRIWESLGINTNGNTSNALTVNGNISSSSGNLDLSNGIQFIGRNATSDRKIVLFDSNTNSTTNYYGFGIRPFTFLYNSDAGCDHLFTTSATTNLMIVKSIGFVGIGTTAPNCKLDVVGTIRGTGMTGTNIYLPTSGGIPSELNYYEETTSNITFSNGFSSNQTVGIKFIRIGKIVTAYFPNISATASGVANPITNTGGSVVPSRFLSGSGSRSCVMAVVSNSVGSFGTITVSQTTGDISIYNNFGNFATTGNNGWYDQCITWTI